MKKMKFNCIDIRTISVVPAMLLSNCSMGRDGVGKLFAAGVTIKTRI
jgi:hypothetical protein